MSTTTRSSANYPLAPLLARPLIAIPWAWFTFLAIMLALTSDHGSAFESPAPGTNGAIAAWRLVVFIPALTGLLANLSVAELFHGRFAWSIPRALERINLGLLLLAITTSVVVAIFVFGTNIVAAGSAFAVGVAAFLVGGTRTRIPGFGGLTSIVAVGAALFLAGPLSTFATANPVITVGLTLVVTGATYRENYSRKASRALFGNMKWTPLHPGESPFRWMRGEKDWTQSLANAELSGWIKAGWHETLGASRFGLTGSVASMITFLWVFFLVVPGSDVWSNGVGLTVMLVMSISPPLLGRVLNYPLSRKRRVPIAFWGTAAAMVVVTTVAFTMLTALSAVSATWRGGPIVGANWLPFQVAVILWLPISTWTQIKYGSWFMMLTPEAYLRGFASLLAAILAAKVTKTAIFEGTLLDSTPSRITALIAVALIVQAGYWIALRRHFLRGDLR